MYEQDVNDNCAEAVRYVQEEFMSPTRWLDVSLVDVPFCNGGFKILDGPGGTVLFAMCLNPFRVNHTEPWQRLTGACSAIATFGMRQGIYPPLYASDIAHTDLLPQAVEAINIGLIGSCLMTASMYIKDLCMCTASPLRLYQN